MIKTELIGKLVGILLIALIVMSVFCGLFPLSAADPSDYNGEILSSGISGDTPPRDIIKGWMLVKNTGKHATFKGVLEIRDSQGNPYKEASDTEVINSGTTFKFKEANLGVRIPSDAEIGTHWDARFKLYVDIGYWKEVDNTSWEEFTIVPKDEPEIWKDKPDEDVVRIESGTEVEFQVKTSNAESVKWYIDNIHQETTPVYSGPSHLSKWEHTFYKNCTVTAKAYNGEKDSSPVNWKIEIKTPPPEHSPQITGYSPSDGSLELDPGDRVDFEVQVEDEDGDLDKVVWKVDGTLRKTDNSPYGSVGESRFNYESEEGDNEVKATVYDLQGNSDFVTWSLGVTVNHCPELSEGKAVPESGDTSDTFVFSVKYKDQDGDEPVDAYVIIEGEGYYEHPMEYQSEAITTGAKYVHSTTLPVGDHRYFFYFNDGHQHNVYLPPDGFSDPFCPKVTVVEEINQAPTLSDGTVDQEFGDTSTEFTYSVIYKDEDNDAPDVRELHIITNKDSSESQHNKYTMTPSGTNPDYTKGVEYTYTTELPLTIPGYKHGYFFKFRDANGHHYVVLPSDSYCYEGPTVADDPLPEILHVDVPSEVYVYDKAIITIDVKNIGAESSEGYISVSFPDNPEVKILSITAPNSKISNPGDQIYDKNGNLITASYRLVDAWDTSWTTGELHTLQLEVMSTEPGPLTVYVRSTMKGKDNQWINIPLSGITDQQGWNVKKYTIDVIPWSEEEWWTSVEGIEHYAIAFKNKYGGNDAYEL